ncbi:MAG: hypothetical protein B7Y39_08075 [Bdellovibrio sp. 28-41-41]|nr:MAG: hypothetical protein B7Y39_08075 [Bdellovibrio sp. 28-41-41]
MYAKIITAIFFSALFCQARVLSLSDEKFASYFAVEGGSSLLKTTPFDENIASVDSYSDEYKVGMGGEFGFVYSSPYLAWRFSFEILKPSKLKEVQGLASATAQYTVDSDVTAVAPKLGLEIHLNKKTNNRFYLFGYYGSSNLTMTHAYTGVVSPNSDHTVEAKGSAAEMGGGLGFEMSFVDTTSFVIEVGYRSLIFKEIKYSKDVTTFQGAKTVGETLTNLNGENRSLNFSGYTASIGFRFWL